MDEKLRDHVLELIRRSSTDLPPDVQAALERGRDQEAEGSSARGVLENILENVRMARSKSTPICQDTGNLAFHVHLPRGTDERPYREAIQGAAQAATKRYLLRPNAVDSLTGKNSGTNIGVNAPVVHFHPWEHNHVQVKLMQKGGGSENVSEQYKLPDGKLHAGRDLKGVRKVVLKAVFDAQGKGCAPGIVAVGIGGDRLTGYELAKAQLTRKVGARSEDPELAKLEASLLEDINSLGIGPMGLGGKTTVLDVFVAAQHRHPATFYVSVAYMCWACRRRSMTIKSGEVTYD
jgi:fumarate hydratase class I